MMDIINKILENNFIFYSIIAVLVLVFLVIIYFAFIYKKDETEEIEEIETKNEDIDVEVLKEQQEAKDELQKVIEQMSEDVQNQKEDNIEEFESDQEENAVISYQELVNNVKSEKISLNLEDIYEDEALQEIENENKALNQEIEDVNINNENIEMVQTKDIEIEDSNDFGKMFESQPINKFGEMFEIDVPESNDEILEMEETNFNDSFSTDFSSLLGNDEIDEEKIMNVVKETPKEENTRKYKKSEIISPIYGRQNIDPTYPKIEAFDRNKDFKDNLIEIERSLKDEPLTDEEKTNQEFLNTLREFRRNL